MIQFRVTTRDYVLKRKFRRALAMFSDLREEMDLVGRWLVRDGRRRLAARVDEYSTGRLGKSLKHKAFKRAVTVTSVQPYARIQQEGGTVKSKRPGGYLAIPLQAREKRNKAWPRHWKSPLVCIKAKSGKLYLLSTKFNQLVYRLIQQVKIPARPYLVKSPELVRLLRSVIARKLDRVEKAA